MDGVVEYANRIKNICNTLKALSNDGAFNCYRKKLFAQLQRLVLMIGLEERFDEFEESDHPREENGRFAPKGSARGRRKGDMKPETPVTFKNPKEIVLSKDKRPITHFNHDDEEMEVAKGIKMRDEYMDVYELCPGKIKHLTVFAGKGAKDKLGVAKYVVEQFGGKAEDWKHVKGMGMVKGRDGKEVEADIHWYENENIGQAGWKIKQYRSEMGEGQIYWKEE